MTTYYIDPTWDGTKSGTFAAPYALYSSVASPVAGDFILLKAGSTFVGNVAATASGTAGNPIIYGVYNATTGARILATLGAATIQGAGGASHNFSTGGQSYIEIECIDVTAVTSASWSGIRLGSNINGNTDGNVARYCSVQNQTCNSGILVQTNYTLVGHTVDHCLVSGNSLFGITIEGSLLGARVTITNNVGNSNGRSGLRAALSAAVNVSGVIANNTFNTNGVTLAFLSRGIGIDIVSDTQGLTVSGNTCNDNYSNGMVMGNLTGTAATNQFIASGNTCLRNGEMGITVSTGGGWVVSGNTCNYNGANRGNLYGRGIELYGGSTKPIGPGIVCFNETSYNYNYIANGTEGVGIGFDDYHTNISVYGNKVIGNEGNGIQFNPNGAAGTSRAFGNLLIDNFSAPAVRAAGWAVATMKGQIACFNTENNVNIFNNTIILTSQAAAPACLWAICEYSTAAGTGMTVQNNIIKGHGVGLKVRTGITRTYNNFYGNTVNVQSNADTTTLSDGTGAVTLDPLLDSYYRSQETTVKNAGVELGGLDYYGKEFKTLPSMGAVTPRAASGGTTTRSIRNKASIAG